ncbi:MULTISPECIES: EF-P 5-aminopentanol modification-associated protein YfmF [Bacillus]|uniref:Zinc protease n=2 Tax=Bacillus TaxID=1386 RepID=A0A0M4FPZ2_9BACI|nr:zinc protease [Bacillus gobiensis]MBP1080074.1 putative Zn-dependent peptidase [Bacillus capparidis]
MKGLTETKHKQNGLTAHFIKTEKFKTITVTFKMLAPLQKETVTKRALFPYVLQRGTKNYPKTSDIQAYLDTLYGATFSVDLTKKGEQHVISFRMEVANEKFLSDQTPLLEKAMQLFSEIIFIPGLENDTFSAHYVSQEKRTMKQRIQAVFDDKMRYSNLRLVQEMCKDEPYALHVNGELEDVEQITEQDLYDAYQKALHEDQLDLYIVGDIDEQQVQNLTEKFFQTKDRENRLFQAAEAKGGQEPKEVIEDSDVKQGKLNIGYRTNIHYGDEDYPALQVFNGLFGGFSHSKLFINVREKESLAYYAASRVESFKGLLMVMSGIEVKNYEKAVTIIQEQFQAMKNGDFSEDEIAQTKAVIKNQMLETLDTSHGVTELLYQQAAAHEEKSVEDILEAIERVTKDEIVQAAAKIELDTTYFLKGSEGEA